MVSVIIPVYNTEKYLEECIKSVINQTYKNIEIILINDGSTDSSLSICKKYLKIDSRVKLINRRHRGVSFARNEGLNKCTGKYIMFLDSDDYYNLDYIERMYNAITSNKCDIVISGFNCFTKKSKRKLEYLDYDKILDFNLIIDDILNKSYFNSISKTIIKKDVIDKNNILFDTTLRFFEDYKFSFTVMKNSKKIMYLSNCLYNYRINENSSTNSLDVNASLEWFNNTVNVLDYISNNMNDCKKKINGIKFSHLCAVLRILCKTKNISYKKFRKFAVNILNEFYIKVPKETINIKEIYFDRKVNKLRSKMILRNQLRLFYCIARFEQTILKVIR